MAGGLSAVARTDFSIPAESADNLLTVVAFVFLARNSLGIIPILVNLSTASCVC